MGNQFDTKVYLKNLFTALENQYQNDPEWTKWNEDRLYFIRELNDNISPHDEPDVCFLTTLCSIARNDQSQSRLASTVMPIFLKDYESDLSNIQTDEDCQNLGLYPKLVPYNWLTNLSSYLRGQNISFAEFIQNMDGLSGLEIRDELKQVIKAKSTFVKRISIFIRDFLEKDTFGIDQNVRNVLNRICLPVNEDILVTHCRNAGVDPGRLERLFYLHGKRMCQSRECNACPINVNCRDHRFNI